MHGESAASVSYREFRQSPRPVLQLHDETLIKTSIMHAGLDGGIYEKIGEQQPVPTSLASESIVPEVLITGGEEASLILL